VESKYRYLGLTSEATQLSSLVSGAPKAAASWYKQIHKVVVVIAIVAIVVAVVIVNYMYKWLLTIATYKWWTCDAKLNTQHVLTGT